MNIGDVTLKNNVFLAPMAGVTDLAFRIICDQYGAGLSYTEMISAKALSFEDKKTAALIETKDLPTAVQLFGSDAYVMGEVVTEAEKHGLFTDINMGCPAPKITGNGEGSALMKDLNLAEKIIDTVCKKASKPVTVKMRSGGSSFTVALLIDLLLPKSLETFPFPLLQTAIFLQRKVHVICSPGRVPPQ